MKEPLLNLLIKTYSKKAHASYCKKLNNINELQTQLLKKIINNGIGTCFGRDHGFKKIKNYNDYKNSVPLKCYESFSNYISLMKQGERQILTKTKTLVLAETSGTISGKKLIPISKNHLKKYILSGKSLLLNYMGSSGDIDIVSGKILYLQGSPNLNKSSVVPSGRLSGITHHYTPKLLKSKKVPSYEINCIEDWKLKVDRIIKSCPHKELKLIAGVPPWVLHFLRRSEELMKRPVREIYPNLKYYIQGGASFLPYKPAFEHFFSDRKLIRLETFASSEGFIGYRFNPEEDDFTLNPDSGIFYEFISLENFKHNKMIERVELSEVQLGEPYILIISSLSGLYGYVSDDIICFTDNRPYKFKFISRRGHSLSIFGEHLIESEIDCAMAETLDKAGHSLVDYFVKPIIKENKKPYYEWHIEFDYIPKNLNKISFLLDHNLMARNSYYKDLIKGGNIGLSRIIPYANGELYKALEKKGRFGGQNKVTRFS